MERRFHRGCNPLGSYSAIRHEESTGIGELPYDARLRELDLYSIKGRLLRADLVQCWKIFHHRCPFEPEEIFTLDPRQSRGHPFRIFKERFSTAARQRFFTCRIVNDWDSLPPPVATASSLETFKCELAKFLGDRLFEYYDTWTTQPLTNNENEESTKSAYKRWNENHTSTAETLIGADWYWLSLQNRCESNMTTEPTLQSTARPGGNQWLPRIPICFIMFRNISLWFLPFLN